MDIVFFTLGKIYFLLVLSKHWMRREIINTLKKVLRQPWNALTLQLSLSLQDK